MRNQSPNRKGNEPARAASPPSHAPALIAAAGARASYRFLEFFTAQIRNPHTRRAYARAATEFFDWLEAKGVTQLAAIESVHVATYIEQLQRARSAPTAKLRLAALRHLFDWMVIGQIMPTNPAAAVRGPRHIVRRGKTPVLDPAEARQLIDAIDTTTVIGLRDRALIGLMVYSFARIGAAIGMRVEDVYTQNRRLWVRLHEKGGKQHAMPCHHNLESYLHAYIDGAGLASDPKALLFQTYSRATGQLAGNPLPQANAYAMIQRRAQGGRITTKIGNHTFRATGVTAYLKNGGTLEKRRADGEPRQHAHDAALRSPRRGSDARRGGADRGLGRSELRTRLVLAVCTPSRHGRACPGHPRLSRRLTRSSLRTNRASRDWRRG